MTRLLFYLLDLIVALVVVRVVGRVFQQLLGGQRMHPPGASEPPRPPRVPEPAPGEMARDPVCGMFVSTEVSHRLSRGGQTLHFCSPDCLERYQENPPHA